MQKGSCFLLNPGLPDLHVAFLSHLLLGMVCCFSGLKFRFSSLLTLCTSRSLVPLVLASEHIWIRNFPSFLYALIFLFSSKIPYALKEIVLFHWGHYHHFSVMKGNHLGSYPCPSCSMS